MREKPASSQLTEDSGGAAEEASRLPRTPLRWLLIFGPGAVVASLTIGTGELIFSSRAGALFGERILFAFLLTVGLKWILVLGSARHLVLSGAHPFERWVSLPGPRGWLPVLLCLLTVPAFPIWVAFHASVIGNLLAARVGGSQSLWAAGGLALVLFLSLVGGYRVLERVQLVLVVVLLAAAGVTLVLLDPALGEIVQGFLVPSRLEYPPWLRDTAPDLAARSIWHELSLYVGVLGGSGFDYLAYLSFLRQRGWGAAGGKVLSEDELAAVAADPSHPNRRWLRAPLIDSALSFAAVLVFSVVFVVCGQLLLAPRGILPDEENMLGHQADFFTQLHPAFLPIYLLGAALTMFGTLYGTLEVAPHIYGELARALGRDALAVPRRRRLRRWTLVLCAAIACLVILALHLHAAGGGKGRPQALIGLITPANLFTGVLCCGLICLLTPWADRRFLPRDLRRGAWWSGLQWVAAAVFLGVGGKVIYESLLRAFAGP